MHLDTSAARRLVVVDAVGLRPDADAPALRAVAAHLRSSDPVEVAVVVHLQDEPTTSDADRVLAHLSASGALLDLPELELVAAHELAGRPVALRLAVDDARAGELLTALAGELRRGAAAPQPQRPAPARHAASPEVARLRSQLAGAATRRDLARGAGPSDEVTVAVVVQHQPTWGAVETVCDALAGRPGVRLLTVAVDSDHDGQRTSTAEFLRSVGHRPTAASWLRAHAADVDVAVLDNPYDALRPEGLRSRELAAAGVRLAYLPYGNNVGDGPEIKQMQYDLELHRIAWRVYARSEQQAEMYGRYCAAGREHVRVLGMPKLDRVLALGEPAGLRRLRRQAAGRPVFLWNPHFSTGPGGWSTFFTHLEPMLAHVAAHPDRFLLLRPHFRLLRDMRAQGGSTAAFEQDLRARLGALPNAALDRTPDYKAAFAAADALLSDASSLVTEFLPTGRPVLYLHRPDGPGINEDAAYFSDLPRAEQWSAVEQFLDAVTRGEDPGAEQRRDTVTRHFGLLDGAAGQRIADDLVAGVAAERRAARTPVPHTSGGAA